MASFCKLIHARFGMNTQIRWSRTASAPHPSPPFDRLPSVLIDTLHEQWDMLGKLDQQVAQIEQRMLAWMQQDKDYKTLAEIPGIGLLTTTAVATMGNAEAFRSGLPPGWGWCRGRRARAARYDCWESANVATPACA